MIGVLPPRFDDELLYGCVARYLAACGLRGRQTARRMHPWGVSRATPMSLCGVSELLTVGGYPNQANLFQSLLFENTLAPYALACVVPDDAPGLVRRLIDEPWKSRYGSLSLALYGKKTSARRVGIRFCDQCVKDDTARIGESYWHRAHQLPCSLVCWIHNEWLRELPKLEPNTLIARPSDVLRTVALPFGRGTPPELYNRLANADRHMLSAGMSGFVGGAVRRTYSEILSGGDLRSVKAMNYDVMFKLTKDVIGRLRATRGSSDALERLSTLSRAINANALWQCDRKTTLSFRHVLLLTLSGISIQDLANEVEARGRCDLKIELNICGDAPCRNYRVTWDSDLRGAMRSTGGRVFGQCARCGFRAVCSPEYKTTVRTRSGSVFIESASELHEEGILTFSEQVAMLRVSRGKLQARWRTAVASGRLVKGRTLSSRAFPNSRTSRIKARPTLV